MSKAWYNFFLITDDRKGEAASPPADTTAAPDSALADGSRRVAGIYEVPSMRVSTDGHLAPIPLWEWEQTDIDEDGKFIGEYVKRNDVSDELRRKRRLAQFPPFTMDDVRKMSELPAHMQKGN